MTNSGANYDPTFVECTGFGQNTSNAAPSLFVESIAIDLDCSVYGSLFVTNNIQVGKNVEIKGNLAVSGPGSFGGVVSAAGFTYGGKSFFGSNQFVVEAPATFLNTLKAAGASAFEGVVTAAKGLVAKALSVAPIPPGFNLNTQSVGSVNPPYYQPTNADGDPDETPIEFVPCVLSQLPPDAVVLAYLPNQNFN
jgi:hypothetical protein